MKRRLKKSTLLLFLLTGLVFIGCVNAIVTTINIGGFDETIDLHKVRLHKLFLGDSDYSGSIVLSDDGKTLLFSTGLIIGSGNNIDEVVGSFIGGGDNNKIQNGSYLGDSYYNGIGGGSSNTIGWSQNGVIGGGSGNTVTFSNVGVVVGGFDNIVNGDRGVVVGGKSNEAKENGVVLGGINNSSKYYSLSFGSGAKTTESSFSWNADMISNGSENNSAEINANSGILIGTVTPIEGVNLVVSGSVKIPSGLPLEEGGKSGEVRYYSGCFYVNNGDSWYVMNRGNHDECIDAVTEGTSCDFGNMKLPNGSEMSGYNVPISNDCDGEKGSVRCEGGELHGAIYPYCYKLTY